MTSTRNTTTTITVVSVFLLTTHHLTCSRLSGQPAQRPGHPEGYPGPVGYPTPETLPGSPIGELSQLIGYRDDVYAAVGHCLTHLVLHGGPLCEILCENHPSNLFILKRETHAAEVCGWLVRIEAHHDGEVLRVIEQYVGGHNFEVLS